MSGFNALVDDKASSQLIAQLESQVKGYSQNFERLVNAFQQRGLDENSGAYGALRSATHELEEAIDTAGRTELLVTLLQVRRSEKDFMLRFDDKYLGRVEGLLDELKRELSATPNLAANDAQSNADAVTKVREQTEQLRQAVIKFIV